MRSISVLTKCIGYLYMHLPHRIEIWPLAWIGPQEPSGPLVYRFFGAGATSIEVYLPQVVSNLLHLYNFQTFLA